MRGGVLILFILRDQNCTWRRWQQRAGRAEADGDQALYTSELNPSCHRGAFSLFRAHFPPPCCRWANITDICILAGLRCETTSIHAEKAGCGAERQ